MVEDAMTNITNKITTCILSHRKSVYQIIAKRIKSENGTRIWKAPYQIQNYLTKRTSRIRIDEITSSVQRIKAGIPQPSAILPIPYSLYTNISKGSRHTKTYIFMDSTAKTATS